MGSFGQGIGYRRDRVERVGVVLAETERGREGEKSVINGDSFIWPRALDDNKGVQRGHGVDSAGAYVEGERRLQAHVDTERAGRIPQPLLENNAVGSVGDAGWPGVRHRMDVDEVGLGLEDHLEGVDVGCVAGVAYVISPEVDGAESAVIRGKSELGVRRHGGRLYFLNVRR